MEQWTKIFFFFPQIVLEPHDMFWKCFGLSRPARCQKTRWGLCCCCCVWQTRLVAESSKLKDGMAPPWSCESVNTVCGFSAVENKSSAWIWRATVECLKESRFWAPKWQRILLRVRDLFKCISGEIAFRHSTFFTPTFTVLLIIYSVDLGNKTVRG